MFAVRASKSVTLATLLLPGVNLSAPGAPAPLLPGTSMTPAEMPAAVPASGSGGDYRIDLDAAPQLVADLRAGAARYREVIHVADRVGEVIAPGQDKVSQTAAANVKRMGQDMGDWLRSRQQELLDAADTMEAQLKAYHHVEEINLPPATRWT